MEMKTGLDRITPSLVRAIRREIEAGATREGRRHKVYGLHWHDFWKIGTRRLFGDVPDEGDE